MIKEVKKPLVCRFCNSSLSTFYTVVPVA